MADCRLFKEIFEAQFLSRPNRFVVKAQKGRKAITAHLPNPGRLKELLFPGSTIYIAPSEQGTRKTRFTAVAVKGTQGPIFLHTGRSNDVVGQLLERQAIPSLRQWQIVPREVVVGHGRINFLLSCGEEKYFLEVKSCTLFYGEGAFFPDAVTERGRRHLLALRALRKKGIRCGVLFAVFNPQARFFLPDWHTDPDFARTLRSVKDAIDILPVAVNVKADPSVESTGRELPIPCHVLEEKLGHGGTYALVARLPRTRIITCGALSPTRFPPGYYVYVGSALNGLDARLARHKRRAKRRLWHIDYLLEAARVTAVYPIRTPERIECTLASKIGRIAPSEVTGFGSNDCTCPSHVFHFTNDPEQMPPFVGAVNSLRFRGESCC